MKKHAPATLRNRDAIAAVLEAELPPSGVVLEIASGSGEHALYFAEKFSALDWQPSDPDPEAIASILAYKADYAGLNLRMPVLLDAQAPDAWEVRKADAILCCNMVHIAPWETALGVFAGAAQILSGNSSPPLIFYGPFFEQGIGPAPSNLAFDEGLRLRNEQWGIRDLEAMDETAAQKGFTRTALHEMPANNLMLVYRPA